MIEKITALNITPEIMNGTRFEQVAEISQQPYMIWGHVVMFGVVLLLWFIWSFTRVSKTSTKLCWESWINIRALIYILIAILLYILIFIFPVPTYWI